MEKEVIKKIVIGISLGFLLGFGSAWIWFDQKTSDISEVSSEEIEDNKTDTQKKPEEFLDRTKLLSAESLQIDTQTAGDVVIVKKASLGNSAWVVVYEDENGELGNILGARLFDAGETSGREVYLLRGMEKGKRYYALFHKESGDNQFDYKEDIVVREENSDRLIITSFLAQ